MPWKYGFKSTKSIVDIELVEEEPVSAWMAAAAYEYGFYANVNPEVDHPRWSQATERRIGENQRGETLMFNGYEDEVAHLYEGMDLSLYYQWRVRRRLMGVKVKTTMRQAINQRWLWLAVNAAAAALLWAAWDFTQGNLIDPSHSLTVRTGQSAIILLLLSLAVTPLVTLTGFRPLATVRKSLGLWAFAYAVLHLLVFVGLDDAFNLDFILKDGLQRKPYILVGAAALLVLLPLALTSTKGWMKRLGRRWKQLHRLVWPMGCGAALCVGRRFTVGQLSAIYALILAVLLLARVPPLRRALAAVGRRPRAASVRRCVSERTAVTSVEPAAIRMRTDG